MAAQPAVWFGWLMPWRRGSDFGTSRTAHKVAASVFRETGITAEMRELRRLHEENKKKIARARERTASASR